MRDRGQLDWLILLAIGFLAVMVASEIFHVCM